MGYKKRFDNKFFLILSFVAVFGSGIRDPGSGMGKNLDPGINIPDRNTGICHTRIAGLLLCPNQLNHTVLHMAYPGIFRVIVVLKILSKMQISIVL
jgi:hypothetical protein